MESHRRPWQDCGGLPWQSEQCRRLRCRHTGLAVVSLAGVGGRRGLRAGTSLVRGHAVGQHILRGLHQVATHPRMSVGPVGGDVFAAERPRLVGLAYRMLAMVEDAEDVVQEAWIRWQAVDPTGLERPAAWLTTVTTRLALDQLRSRSRRREDYVGPWLPEPLVSAPGPEEAAELADSLTLGFLTLLDRLTPIERAVFVLADVFRRALRGDRRDRREVGACVSPDRHPSPPTDPGEPPAPGITRRPSARHRAGRRHHRR